MAPDLPNVCVLSSSLFSQFHYVCWNKAESTQRIFSLFSAGRITILLCLCLSDGFDQCLSELALTCLFLPMSVMRNLLMSIWTELACLLASIFLVSSIGVCLKCFPTSYAKSVCPFLPMPVMRNLLMSTWIELACLLASIFLVSSIGVCLKCFPLLVCQCLSSGATWFLSGFFLKRGQQVSF